MPVCDQDHGGVAVPVAGPLAGSFLEPLDLLFSQVFPRPKLGIGGPAGNCQVYWVEGAGLRADFVMRINLGLDRAVRKVVKTRTVVKCVEHVRRSRSAHERFENVQPRGGWGPKKGWGLVRKLSNYERGQRRIDVLELLRIVEALGGDPNKVLSVVLSRCGAHKRR